MLQFILLGIVILVLATLYVSRQKKTHILFDKVCDGYLLFVLLHAAYVFVIRFVFGNHSFIDITAPFVLGYGPFFFIGLRSLLDEKLNKKVVFLHFSPLLIFTLIYILVVSNFVYREKYLLSLYVTLYSFVSMSMFGYAFWVIVFNKDLGKNSIKEKKQLLRTSGISLLVVGLLFIIVTLIRIIFREKIKINFPGIIIYGSIFISVLLAFKFRINNLIAEEQQVSGSNKIDKPILTVIQKDESKTPKDDASQQLQKYNKSALSSALLEDYRIKLDHLISVERVYLDNDLTLELLAKQMKIPMHHLTQLFNVYLGENFNQYINKFRITYACQLLTDNNESLSIEQVAFNSGFNSKVSFNRHFKNILGYTPKEYIYKNKK